MLKYYFIGFSVFSIAAFAQNNMENIGNNYFPNKQLAQKQQKTTQTVEQNKPSSSDDQNGHVEQYGNNYFSNTSVSQKLPNSIRQLGIAVELRDNSSIFYGFFNQLRTNHIYYEGRVYALYNYLNQLPPAPPNVPQRITVSDELNTVGYGGVGILGYNFDINNNVSLLPFFRFQMLRNGGGTYADIYGNKISSVLYAFLPGARLALRINDVFALGLTAYGGYQLSVLSGYGIYAVKGNPHLNIYSGILEFSTPYKITKTWSITPYVRSTTMTNNPNQAARNIPYSVNQLTNTNYVFAIRLGYEF